ncbi:roadblock/LC7 domain-containing protein [candidate division WOR-3 bacterium]|nr:roadblock/LC7 domain-containing protein [candidate division WOR-3 bacterium]
MAQSRAERIHVLLEKLRSFDIDIEGVAVATTEGLVIASSLEEGLDEERLSAICGAVAAVSKSTAEELRKGLPTEMIIKAPEGFILILRTGITSLMVAVTLATANLGLVLIDMRKIAQEIAPILDQ